MFSGEAELTVLDGSDELLLVDDLEVFVLDALVDVAEEADSVDLALQEVGLDAVYRQVEVEGLVESGCLVGVVQALRQSGVARVDVLDHVRGESLEDVQWTVEHESLHAVQNVLAVLLHSAVQQVRSDRLDDGHVVAHELCRSGVDSRSQPLLQQVEASIDAEDVNETNEKFRVEEVVFAARVGLKTSSGDGKHVLVADLVNLVDAVLHRDVPLVRELSRFADERVVHIHTDV